MDKNKNLVEEAIIQIKNLEEAISENAKGILESTMAEEIKELVKESLNEQGDDEEEVTPDAEVEDLMGDVEPMDDVDPMDDEEPVDGADADNVDLDDEEPVIDLTQEENPEEVLRVFQLMGPEDEIIVKKDESGNINLKDNKNNTEYMIVGESEEEYYESDMWENDDDLMEFEDEDEDITSIIDDVFSESYDEEEADEEVVYEIEMDEEEEDMMESYEDEIYEMDDMDMMESEDEDEEEMFESYDEDMEDSMDLDAVMESKSIKPKGVGIGKPKKVDFKPNTEGGFKVVKKKANKTMGTGKAKFTYKDGENLDGKMKPVKGKKAETKEAARTLGNGSNFRKGGLPKPRAHSKFNTAIKESTTQEVQILREKNEEYRKALNVFRDKLNEVAVFNSNLAYATRLFTEHTTSKQEKINILKRFDSVETLKESKNLYKSIKDELTNSKAQPMNESIEKVMNNTPSSGSAINLIESKTYENPQFLRMKDLMTKLR
jgi:hypothetical protein